MLGIKSEEKGKKACKTEGPQAKGPCCSCSLRCFLSAAFPQKTCMLAEDRLAEAQEPQEGQPIHPHLPGGQPNRGHLQLLHSHRGSWPWVHASEPAVELQSKRHWYSPNGKGQTGLHTRSGCRRHTYIPHLLLFMAESLSANSTGQALEQISLSERD